MASTPKSNFVVSCDTCADMTRSWYEQNDVKYIIMKRVINGKEICECFDTDADFDKFYDTLKKGETPTTTQVNPFEFREYFEKILRETTGDLIHVPLSSGLSNTCNNAITASNEINKELETQKSNRRIYILDSLMGTIGIGQLVEYLVNLRNAGTPTETAIQMATEFRDHQQGWVIMTDLFHLKRGGRISPTKALIGAILNVRPIIHISRRGKLAMENRERGNFKAVKYILSRMEKYGEKFDKNCEVWIVRTTQSELFELMKDSIRSQYPEVKIRTSIVGPIIGTHLGCGGVGVLFHGAPRLDIE